MRFLHLLALGFLFLLASCFQKSPKADLVFINGSEPESLDPAAITGQIEGRLASEIFEGLLRFNQDGIPEPAVATSWEISPDKKSYLFHLRPEACWSDGHPVVASDFVASWKRILEPETAAPYREEFFILEGAEEFSLAKNKTWLGGHRPTM